MPMAESAAPAKGVRPRSRAAGRTGSVAQLTWLGAGSASRRALCDGLAVSPDDVCDLGSVGAPCPPNADRRGCLMLGGSGAAEVPAERRPTVSPTSKREYVPRGSDVDRLARSPVVAMLRFLDRVFACQHSSLVPPHGL
jgi:hypothetical protein